MKKNKSTIDTNSIHKGLIDNYNIDDPKMKKDASTNVQDFQSVAESIEKLERIIEDGKDLAKKEGIFCGTSSGMNVAAAIQISKELGPKSRVVTVACDTGLKYLSEGLFDD